MDDPIGLQLIRQDLDALSIDIANLANASDDQSIEAARLRVRRIRAEMAKIAAGRGSESPSAIVGMADKAIEPAEDFLGERPIATIGLGLGLGFVVGLLLWRR